MSSNQYPTPVSPSAPLADDSFTSPGAREYLVQSQGRRGHLEERAERRFTTSSRQGLQSVAASLEAAFLRLEQVRASLLQLSDRLSDSNSTLNGPRTSIGPPHGAILLSGSLSEQPSEDATLAQDNEQTNVVSEFQDSLRRAVQAQSSLTQLFEQTAALRQGYTISSSAQVPPVRLSHRPLPPDHPSTSQSLDDGFTSIGREVAARAAPTREVVAQPSIGPPPLDIPPSRPIGQSSGRILDPLVEEPLSVAERASQTGDPHELGRGSQAQNQLASPAPSPLQARSEIRRRSTRASTRSATSTARETGSTSSEQTSRLSMLSSLSLNNLNGPGSPTPFSPGGPLPRLSIPPPSILLEEQEALIASPTELVQEPLFVEDTPSGRSYVVRRRVDETGAERIQTLLWMDDDFDARSLPPPPPISVDPTEGPITRRRMLSNFQERTQRVIPLPPRTTTRRRVWTSLDPDGNGHPMAEDEESQPYPRYMTYQSRPPQPTLDRYAATFGMHPSPSPLDERGVFALPEPPSPSVPQHASSAPAALQAESKVHCQYESTPLPMSLEDMVPSKQLQDLAVNDAVFYVPRYASFVGR